MLLSLSLMRCMLYAQDYTSADTPLLMRLRQCPRQPRALALFCHTHRHAAAAHEPSD